MAHRALSGSFIHPPGGSHTNASFTVKDTQEMVTETTTSDHPQRRIKNYCQKIKSPRHVQLRRTVLSFGFFFCLFFLYD